MADTIALYTIGGDECIGDSLPKINANALSIQSFLNKLSFATETLSANIPAAQTVQFYETQVGMLSAEINVALAEQTNHNRFFRVLKQEGSGLFLTKPFSTILSSVCFNLSSFNGPLTPEPALLRQTLVYDLDTQTWTPRVLDVVLAPLLNPNGYRISNWDTTNDTTTKLTSSNYVSLPGGMIMQFGRLSAAAGAGVAGRSTSREIYVQFPLPFPNDVLNITTNTVVSGINGGVSAQSYIKQGFDRFGFTIVKSLSGNGNIFEMWSAIGR